MRIYLGNAILLIPKSTKTIFKFTPKVIQNSQQWLSYMYYRNSEKKMVVDIVYTTYIKKQMIQYYLLNWSKAEGGIMTME